MGFFLWGVAFGWAACALYFYSQTDDSDRAASGAVIIFFMIVVSALVISFSLGPAPESSAPATPTPTSLGR